jgi:hypothetical protein
VLFDRGFGLLLPQLLDLSRHDDGRELTQGNAARVTPAGESGNSAGISSPRVAIPDVSSKELNEAANGIASSVGEQSEHAPGSRSRWPRWHGDDL